MFEIIKTRIRQKHRTIAFPLEPPKLPDRFRGLPIITAGHNCDGCAACANACPTGACTPCNNGAVSIDLGKCVFCRACTTACPNGTITFSGDYRMAVSRREDCIVSPGKEFGVAQPLPEKLLRLYKRSFKIRVVSAGGCNACEADVNVLSTIVFDLSRFGIQYVASPRHADAMLVMGPVPRNMHAALKKTYDAIAEPKIVIAVGACAISGGLFSGLSQNNDGAGALVPVDLFIPGCPPNPITILDGLLRILKKV